MRKRCTETGCTRRHLAKGLCQKHYYAQHRKPAIEKKNGGWMTASTSPGLTFNYVTQDDVGAIERTAAKLGYTKILKNLVTQEITLTK